MNYERGCISFRTGQLPKIRAAATTGGTTASAIVRQALDWYFGAGPGAALLPALGVALPPLTALGAATLCRSLEEIGEAFQREMQRADAAVLPLPPLVPPAEDAA